MSRKSDLEDNILKSYKLIQEYLVIIRNSDRPEEKARGENQVKQQWSLIHGYKKEYMEIQHKLGFSIPDNINEVLINCPDEPPPETSESWVGGGGRTLGKLRAGLAYAVILTFLASGALGLLCLIRQDGQCATWSFGVFFTMGAAMGLFNDVREFIMVNTVKRF